MLFQSRVIGEEKNVDWAVRERILDGGCHAPSIGNHYEKDDERRSSLGSFARIGGWPQQITTVTLVIAAIVCLTAAPVSAQDRQDAQDRRNAPERQAERGPNVVIIFSDDES